MDTNDVSLEFLRVVEQAAIASAHTMGQGDRPESDHVAVEAMRRERDAVPLYGTIVIGDGVRTSSRIMQTHPYQICFIDSIHVNPGDTVKIRF